MLYVNGGPHEDRSTRMCVCAIQYFTNTCQRASIQSPP